MILCSQAQLEKDNKGVNVKRGQRAKLEMGHRPCLASIGYLNEKLVERGKSRILIDSKRGPLVRQMFELVANKFYTGRELYAWCKEYGLDTRSCKSLTLSGIYRMLSSTFYYGEFEWPEKSGSWYKGSHEPLITKELFQKARGNLLAAHRSKPGTKEFNFTSLINCGSCGSGITAEEKFKHSKDGRMTRYIYYHCTRFQNPDCPEPFVREEELLMQLMDLVDKLDLDKLGIKKQVEQELERFKNFSFGILGKMIDQDSITKAIDTKSYAKHILEHGTKDEKHLLLQSLKSRMFLKSRKLKVGKARDRDRTQKT